MNYTNQLRKNILKAQAALQSFQDSLTIFLESKLSEYQGLSHIQIIHVGTDQIFLKVFYIGTGAKDEVICWEELGEFWEK